MLKFNSANVNILKRLGAALSSLKFNGVKVWPALSSVSTFTFELSSADPTIDLWLTQSAARAVTVTMDDGTVLTSSQLKAEFPYRFSSGGTHTVTVEVEDGETWTPGADFGSTNHHAFTGQIITDSATNTTLKTAVFGRGVDLSSADAFGAFSKCAGLTSVDFSGCDETTITWEVFGDCSSLTTVVWGNIQNIGNLAFHDCGFVELHIPSTIDTVAQQAFSSLSSLLRVEVAAKHVAPQAVAHCANLQYIWVRNSCLELQANAPDNKRYTTQWNGCNPNAQFCCEAASKPAAWGGLYDAYDYDHGYLRYSTVWGCDTSPWESQWIVFHSPSSFTLSVADWTKTWNGTIEYSTDTETWTVWEAGRISAARNGSIYYLFLRGSGNTKVAGNSYNKGWKLTGNNVSCDGDIRCLLDYNNPRQTTMANLCFSLMFYNCTNLISPPSLPSTSLSDNCYWGMFNGCTSLAVAPELPAKELTKGCYKTMFRNCRALKTAPNLPAKKLAPNCYELMFSECELLEKAPPVLPATQLAESCYYQMFECCESLLLPPELPATELAAKCYHGMFGGCTSLEKAPALPATTLASECYRIMFAGCSALSSLPTLGAEQLDSRCYYRMFAGCTGIKLSTTQTGEYQNAYRIPSVGTGVDAYQSLVEMFDNTGGTFTGTPTINTTYYTSNTVIS